MRVIKYALLASLAIATPALAADLAPQPVEPAVPIVVPYSWTGFYAGLHAGAVFGDSKASVPEFGASASFNGTGFIGGAHAGYNEQFDNNIVVGLEGDIDYTSLSENGHGGAFGVGGSARLKSDWQGSIRARAGYAFDRFLPYVTGGVAFGDEKFSANAIGLSTSQSKTRTGWTVGGGLEYAIDDHWSVRGEVRYTDFGRQNLSLFGNELRVKTRFSEVTTELGVSYKF